MKSLWSVFFLLGSMALAPSSGYGSGRSSGGLSSSIKCAKALVSEPQEFVVDGNYVLTTKQLYKYQGDTLIAKFGDELVEQQLLPATGKNRALAQELERLGTDPDAIQKGIIKAQTVPAILERYFALHPKIKNRDPHVAFENGVEYGNLVVNDVASEFITSHSPTTTDFDIGHLIDPSVQVKSLTVNHRHPEPGPLSLLDYQFAKALAEKYSIMVTINAFVRADDGAYFVFTLIAMPRDMSSIIVNPDEP